MRDKMLKIADRLDARAEARTQNTVNRFYREMDYCRQQGKECLAEPPTIDEVSGTLHIIAEEIRETLSLLETEEYTGGGDVFTIEDFTKQCGVGFIDSDGEGYYASNLNPHGKIIMVRNLPARASRITVGDVNEDVTHVVGYNK